MFKYVCLLMCHWPEG